MKIWQIVGNSIGKNFVLRQNSVDLLALASEEQSGRVRFRSYAKGMKLNANLPKGNFACTSSSATLTQLQGSAFGLHRSNQGTYTSASRIRSLYTTHHITNYNHVRSFRIKFSWDAFPLLLVQCSRP
jgi:hypothetical protein